MVTNIIKNIKIKKMRKKKKFTRARRAMLVLPTSMLGSAPRGTGGCTAVD